MKTFLVLASVDALLDEEEGARGEIKDILLDVVVVVKDLFSSFVTTDQLEADVDIVEFISAIVEGEFGMEQVLQLKLNEARIAYVDDLLEDVYVLLEEKELVDTVIELMVDALEIQEPTIENQNDFVNYFYGIAKSILVDGKIPEALIVVENPQD